MADILIRGMEMPTNCFECWVPCTVPFEDRNHLSRADNCPLIALPEGHGRLVDADALEKTVEEAVYQYWNGNGGGYYLAEDAIPDICFAPTIVPAEKEDV